MESRDFWKLKLLAFTHDPAEKALILMRDRAGHEGGTVKKLRQEIFGDEPIPEEWIEIVKRADRWASAADRPAFPKGERHSPEWARVRFYQHPELVHPLSGRRLDLLDLEDLHGISDPEETGIDALKKASLDQQVGLIRRQEDGGAVDFKKTLLALWRLGPDEKRAPKGIGKLWEVLPADTRTPHHSIWEHLRLVSALAGAMAADARSGPALLALTYGPVQTFIRQSRSTSDLWSGSHLLSRIAWAGLKVICERFGPDAVVFPDLHGVPFLDAWLCEEGVLDRDELPREFRRFSDAHPLFSAVLPNRFLAIVPSDQAEAVAADATRAMRTFVQNKARAAVDMLLKEAEGRNGAEECMLDQIEKQMEGFPEVHHAIVPWSLAGTGDAAAPDPLKQRLALFVPSDEANQPAHFGTRAWRIVSGEHEVEDAPFFKPNPGYLYGPLTELLFRILDAGKSLRPFKQLKQEGYRCTLCGEREWLTGDRAQLGKPRGKRSDTIWQLLASKKPSWARRDEHLCALCTLKRLWPSLFLEEVRPFTEKPVHRYVVSTHTMALAPTLDRLSLGSGPGESVGSKQRIAEELLSLAQKTNIEGAALPGKLAKRRMHDLNRNLVRLLPGLLDRASEEREVGSLSLQQIQRKIGELTGSPPERYYALVKMDGDRMGRILSGKAANPPLKDLFHSDVREGLFQNFLHRVEIMDYLEEPPLPSPARHVAISRSLNAFALHIARTVTEDVFLGKVLYSGGDDLLAMVGIDDLLGLILTLRYAWSGILPPGDPLEVWKRLGVDKAARPAIRRMGYDHVLLGNGRLLRTMGARSTVSIGAVIAHHTTPLAAVLRRLDEAEKTAKESGGRDAFSITLMKRSGGTSTVTAPFAVIEEDEGATASGCPRVKPLDETSLGSLMTLRDLFASQVSRRAAYKILEWLPGVPPDNRESMLAAALAHQFSQQRRPGARFDARDAADAALRFAETAAGCIKNARENEDYSEDPYLAALRDGITLAEFLAREQRAPDGRSSSMVATVGESR